MLQTRFLMSTIFAVGCRMPTICWLPETTFVLACYDLDYSLWVHVEFSATLVQHPQGPVLPFLC